MASFCDIDEAWNSPLHQQVTDMQDKYDRILDTSNFEDTCKDDEMEIGSDCQVVPPWLKKGNKNSKDMVTSISEVRNKSRSKRKNRRESHNNEINSQYDYDTESDYSNDYDGNSYGDYGTETGLFSTDSRFSPYVSKRLKQSKFSHQRKPRKLKIEYSKFPRSMRDESYSEDSESIGDFHSNKKKRKHIHNHETDCLHVDKHFDDCLECHQKYIKGKSFLTPEIKELITYVLGGIFIYLIIKLIINWIDNTSKK